MARNHATIYAAIWNDPEFVTMKASTQRLYLLLLSQPDLNSCGVIAYRPKVWARLARDSNAVQVTRDARELAARRFVAIDEATDELAVRSFMRHDGVLKAPNIFKAAARAFGTIHSTTIRQSILDALPPLLSARFPDEFTAMHPKAIGAALREGLAEGFPEGFQEPLPEGFGEPPVRASSTLHPPSSTNPPAKASPSPSTQPAADQPPKRPAATPPANPEEGTTPTPETTADLAIDHMANCDLHHAQAGPTPIRQPDRWHTTARTARHEAHHAHLVALAQQQPTADPVDLAEQIDPLCGPLDGGLARATARWEADLANLQATSAEAEQHRRDLAAADLILSDLTRDELQELDQAARDHLGEGSRFQPLVDRQIRVLVLERYAATPPLEAP